MEECDTMANKTLAEKHLRKFGHFLETNSLRLMKILSNNKDGFRGGGEEDDAGGGNGEEEPDEGYSSGNLIDPYLFVESYPSRLHISHEAVTTCPIELKWTPVQESGVGFEEIISIPLPPDANPDVQKVLLVLTNLSTQFDSLKHQIHEKFVIPLLLYGDGYEDDSSSSLLSIGSFQGEGHVAISKFLLTLHRLQAAVKLGKELCIHWMEQMSALFKDAKPHVVATTHLNIPTTFRAFADFLAMFVIVDNIIVSQAVFQEHWAKYRQMISSVHADATTFDSAPEQLAIFEKDLFILDKEVVSGQIFRTLLTDLSNFGKKTFGKSTSLLEKLQSYIIQTSATIEKEFAENIDTLKPIAVSALFIFASTLFPSSSDWKKLFQKHLCEPMKRVPAVSIGSSILWIPDVFLNSFIRLYDSRGTEICAANRQNYLQQSIASLPRDVTSYSILVSTWAVKLQQAFYSRTLNQLKLEDLSRRCSLILHGAKLAQWLNNTFKMVMSLHAHFNKPVTKQLVCHLCHILELLKEIQCTYHRFSVHCSNSSIYIIQHVLNTALTNLKEVQKMAVSPEYKKMDALRADSLTVLKMLENAMRGPPSSKRLLVARLALDWALGNPKLWKGGEDLSSVALILPAAIERVSLLTDLNDRVNQLCNGSELVWHRVILHTYFSAVYDNEVESSKLPLMCMVMTDCYSFLNRSPHSDQVKKSFKGEVDRYFKNNLMNKLCQEVETDLRLLAHSHLQVVDAQDASSPFKTGVKDYRLLLTVPTLSLGTDRLTSLRLATEHYLSATFYNLASVALHDWQSYATMRVLASDKYKLDVTEDCLPGHSLEQGRDILEIVRNLPQFVMEFTYNLNNQVFVQISSPNKHLDVVNIRHLANSMRTHGIGMASTTINAVYQYLRSSMQVFSQCLYDEQIRSRLSKDIRIFKQSRYDQPNAASPSLSSLSNFPFEFAEKFKKGIKKLGVQDGLTWLDKFRMLITHIGNALGFVRLVRSGGLHYLASGCQFVPDLEDTSNFSTKAELDVKGTDNLLGMSKSLERAVKSVDATLANLTINFFLGEDYFGLLLKAFKAVCRQERNAHLKNFYVLIPALTLSYVEHMRQCKEMLPKRSKSSSIFTNDGFPMGVAYFLQVLGQDDDFDALGWFSSVKQHYEEEKRREVLIINESKKDEKLEQTSKLTAKRFHDHILEFELLRYNLSSARIFFQRNGNNSQLGEINDK